MASHKHKWRESGWTLSGLLALRVECMACLRSIYFQPRKRLRTPPEGMTVERFEHFKLVAEEPELLEAFRARLVTATNKQLSEATRKGIAPPLPTFDGLEAYRERTADRLAKREPDPPSPGCTRHPESDWRPQSPAWSAYGVDFPGTYICNICHPVPVDGFVPRSLPARFCDLDCIDEAIARHAKHPSVWNAA